MFILPFYDKDDNDLIVQILNSVQAWLSIVKIPVAWTFKCKMCHRYYLQLTTSTFRDKL